ncbi:MAG: hypothetical protein OES46_18650 [Gammaproteobacteria bacterium]|nr:hypothetical protein [Gammaproteobacteria bacterium]
MNFYRRYGAPLELALRYARVDQDEGVPQSVGDEITAVANWFFSGHRNKLSVDVSRLNERQGEISERGWRVRLQWDVSI